MREHLFFHIGCTYTKEHFIKSLLGKSYSLCIIDEIGVRPKMVEVPYHCVYGKRLEEILAVILNVAQENDIALECCHFFTLAEGSVNLLNRILKYYGKPPISCFDDDLNDKYWVRRRLEEDGVECLPYLYLAKCPAEIPSVADEQFPLIVKPLESMESRCVSKVESNDELRRACLEIFTKNVTHALVDHGEIIVEEAYNQYPFALIESCLPGEKLSAEVLVFNGKRVFTAFTSKFDSDNDFFFERGHMLNPAYFSQEEQFYLSNFVDGIICSLQVNTSLLHIELFLDRAAKVVHLLEVNFRMAGSHLHELIEGVYQVHLVSEYLKIQSGAENLDHLHEINHNPCGDVWVDFVFLTGSGGVFYPEKFTAFGKEILWLFDPGQRVAKFATSRFFKLGYVVFPTKPEELQQRLEHLRDNSHEYFTLRDAESLGAPGSPQEGVKRSVFKFLRAGMAVLLAFACILSALYLYRSFDTQSQVMGESMAKLLSLHLANGEGYQVGNVLHNFEHGNVYRKIAVTDLDKRVIYSISSEKLNPYFYMETLNTASFDRCIPIRMNGFDLGFLVYDVNYRIVVAQLLLGFLLLGALVYGLYFVIAKHLFGRLAAQAQEEGEQFIAIVNDMKLDLEQLQEKNTGFSVEKYQQLLSFPGEKHRFFGGMGHSLMKLAAILNELKGELIEKKRLSNLLDESTKQLIQTTAQAEMAKVTAQLAHDMRKPFSQVQAMLEQLGDLRDHPSALEGAKREIKKSIRNVESMLSDIMDYSREVKVESHPVGLVGVLDFSLRQASAGLSLESVPDIRFAYDLGHTRKPLLDEERMARALGNLFGNGIEAITIIGKKEKGTLWIHSRDTTFQGAPAVELCVGNDGPPFLEEDISKLFSSFFTKGKKKGTGLGLASVEKILRLHGGTVSARNMPSGTGVEFILVLPASLEMELKDSSSHILPEGTVQIAAQKLSLSSAVDTSQWMDKILSGEKPLKVLLLEDETLYRAAVKNVLSRDEQLRKNVVLYDAETVDGALALLAQEGDIQYAIVDIDLGEMQNGFDFLRAVQVQHPALRCMVHTNRCIEEDRALAKTLGAVNFVSKPLNYDDLTSFLAQCEEEEHVTLDVFCERIAAGPTLPCPLLCYIADDSFIMRKAMTMKVVEAIGETVALTTRTFETPESMLESAEKEAPDLVLCDYHFDEHSSMTGIDALTKLKAMHPAARFFLVSNVDDEIGQSLVEKNQLSGFIRPIVTGSELRGVFAMQGVPIA